MYVVGMELLPTNEREIGIEIEPVEGRGGGGGGELGGDDDLIEDLRGNLS